jgi:hypothetical protein
VTSISSTEAADHATIDRPSPNTLHHLDAERRGGSGLADIGSEGAIAAAADAGEVDEAVDLFTESRRLFAGAGADHLLLTEAFNLAACRLGPAPAP